MRGWLGRTQLEVVVVSLGTMPHEQARQGTTSSKQVARLPGTMPSEQAESTRERMKLITCHNDPSYAKEHPRKVLWQILRALDRPAGGPSLTKKMNFIGGRLVFHGLRKHAKFRANPISFGWVNKNENETNVSGPSRPENITLLVGDSYFKVPRKHAKFHVNPRSFGWVSKNQDETNASGRLSQAQEPSRPENRILLMGNSYFMVLTKHAKFRDKRSSFGWVLNIL